MTPADETVSTHHRLRATIRATQVELAGLHQRTVDHHEDTQRLLHPDTVRDAHHMKRATRRARAALNSYPIDFLPTIAERNAEEPPDKYDHEARMIRWLADIAAELETYHTEANLVAAQQSNHHMWVLGQVAEEAAGNIRKHTNP